MNSSLYIFDLHGTLVKGNEDAMRVILEQIAGERSIDVTIDKQKLVDLMGVPLEDVITSFVSHASLSDITEMTARFRELSDEITPDYLELLEGTKETLVELRSRGNKIAIVTSANQKMARKMVKWVSLENLVDEVIGMRVKEDAVTFKTQSIERLRHKYDCQRVYMIGDKAEDMKAGYRARAVTVLLGPREAEQEYANLIIPDLQALLNFCGQIPHDC